MDTDQCIQKLVRTDQEGSECAQRKIEETIQYWVAQEKKAVMNYCHALELNNTVSNKRVQQLYSEDQPQEVIDPATSGLSETNPGKYLKGRRSRVE